MGRTILEYCGDSGGSSCGYCRNRKSGDNNGSCKLDNANKEDDEDKEEGVEIGDSHCLGQWAHSLSASDYLALMDMGWRRSGKYLYKPTNEITCCPQYTIRLDVTKFVLSRSQKRTLRQMNEYLISGKKPRCSVKDEDTREEVKEKKDVVVVMKEEKSDEKSKKDEDRPVIKKKEMRRKRFEEKCRLKNLDIDEEKRKRALKEESRRRTIESYILENSDSNQHKLEVKLISTSCDEFQTRDNESFELYKKYQMTIHKDEEAGMANYKRFLCDSPIEKELDSTGKVNLGSHHLWFLLDNKLIAVSVIDVLPKCYSAKYMFYDPDFSFLSLGTYTALREIEFTRKFYQLNPEIRWYYMGYYIDSCPKMRYKAKFRPSDLLCDQSFQWLDIESCKPIFAESKEANGYAVFRPELPPPTASNYMSMLIFSNQQVMPYSIFLRRNREFERKEEFDRKLQDLAKKVGPNLPNAVFYFNELN